MSATTTPTASEWRNPDPTGQRMARLAERHIRRGNWLPTSARGRFDRERLPNAEDYIQQQGIQGPKERGGKWRTFCCPMHNGWSLRINSESGAWACMSCGVSGGDILALHQWTTNSGFVEAARALGAWVADGQSGLVPLERRPNGLSAVDCLSLIKIDLLCVMQALTAVYRKRAISEADMLDANKRAARILRLIDSRGGNHA